MHFNRLKQFRQQCYASFERGADALFNLCDALLCEDRARSLPELSQASFFERRWPSVYQALEQGRINEPQLRQAWLSALLAEIPVGETLWISVDASSIARPDAVTSADRGIIHVPNLPRAAKPISVGWQFSTITLLPEEPSSWVGILDQQRIATSTTAIAVAIEQLRRVIPLLNHPVVIVADRWYASADFLRACHSLGCQVLIRLKRNRKLYRQPVRRHTKGREPLDGSLFQGSHPETLGGLEAAWFSCDELGTSIAVSRWSQLHFRQARDIQVSVLRVLRMGARDTKRDPRESWYIMLDGAAPVLALHQIMAGYKRRFSHEHAYRFLKQDLLWTQAHLRTPDQFARWSLLVAVAFNQLVLSRPLGQAHFRPWEKATRALSPRQVRRAMGSILMQLGTPARACQRRGKSPGRARGFHPQPAPRYEVVIKHPKKALVGSG